MQDVVFGIRLDAEGREKKVKLAKGETVIFSSSLFLCFTSDATISTSTMRIYYDTKYPTWIKSDSGEILSQPRYRIFLYMDHYSTLEKEQQILDSDGQTTVYVKGIIDGKYVVNSLIADTFDEAAKCLADEKHAGRLWPKARLVDSHGLKGDGNGSEPVQKWNATEKKQRIWPKVRGVPLR